MDFSKIVTGVLDMADLLAPLLEGTPVGAVVKAANKAIELIDDITEIASEDEAAALAEMRAVLEPKVLKHLDDTIESLD